MKYKILLLTFFFSLNVYAIPELVHCSNSDAEGNVILHTFDFSPRPDLVYPQQFDVRIFISKTLFSNVDPDAPVSSDDPLPTHEVVFDRTLSAHQSETDINIVYLNPDGFVQVGNNTVTFQLPESSQDMAEVVQNCVLPEPRAGVGNGSERGPR